MMLFELVGNALNFHFLIESIVDFTALRSNTQNSDINQLSELQAQAQHT